MRAGVKVCVGGCDVGGWVRERQRERFLSLLLGEALSFFLIFFSSIFLLLTLSYFCKNGDCVGDLFWFCFKPHSLAPSKVESVLVHLCFLAGDILKSINYHTPKCWLYLCQ